MTRRLASVLAVMVSVAGCGGNGTAPSPTSTSTSSVVSPAGTWSGSISDSISGDGTVQLTLENQTPNALIGTWSATFRNGDSFSGPALASPVSPTGYGLMLYVEPQPPCAVAGGRDLLGYTLINVTVTSSRLTAVAGRTSCNGFSFGTVDLSKR